MTDRTTKEAKREAFESWFIRKYLRASQDSLDLQPDLGICQAWQAALQWQAEQQKGEALPKIASEVRIMLGSATELFDGIGDIVGYQIKTGALHRILGLLSGAGHPVAIAAKNQSVALAASPHGVPPGYVLAAGGAAREADREAMRMALEALKVLTDEPTPAYVAISKADAAIKALEQRVGES